MSDIEQQKTCGVCSHFLRTGFCSVYFNSLRAFGDVRVNKDSPSCKYMVDWSEDKNCKLFASFNLGASYRLIYQCDDTDDEVFNAWVKHLDENLIRFYVDFKDKPDEPLLCDIHKKTIAFLKGEDYDPANTYNRKRSCA